MSFCVRSIRIFSKFSCDPYYEPLSWFMIGSEATKKAGGWPVIRHINFVV